MITTMLELRDTLHSVYDDDRRINLAGGLALLDDMFSSMSDTDSTFRELSADTCDALAAIVIHMREQLKEITAYIDSFTDEDLVTEHEHDNASAAS